MATIVLPDVEKMLIEQLRTHPDVQPLTGGQPRVSTEIPDTPVFPRVVLFQVGGTQRWRGWLHSARIQVESWAGRRDETPPGSRHKAHELARVLEGVILSLRGLMPTVGSLGVVTQVNALLDPSWQPDEPSTRPRFIAEYEVVFHPLT
jgi:hypothetical protein